MFDMMNIFETFLPQLLRYPNASDPLNGEASALMMRDPRAYREKIRGECLGRKGGGLVLWLWIARLRRDGDRGREVMG